ncbi:DUF397 domain-containing protein [Amycolatopsis sp. NPDC098790]|uniref:DUF397 domain-containing protein n=1 Tax=Amycolatopsis sp. NPDC098790 TaxID=3363939 RepID=UPI0037F5A9D9
MTNATPSAAASSRSGWFKSSYSNATGSCVETKFEPGAILVRDSKDRRADQPVVEYPSLAWSFFISGLLPENS